MAWTADTATRADAGQVIEILTRPCAITSWAPVPFEVEGLDSDRLETGSRARVAGKLAGKDLTFDVEVHEASTGALRLTATGPFLEMDVAYDIDQLDAWAHVRASIDVKGKGTLGRFVARAVEGYLAAGAMETALSQLAIAAENPDLTLAAVAA